MITFQCFYGNIQCQILKIYFSHSFLVSWLVSWMCAHCLLGIQLCLATNKVPETSQEKGPRVLLWWNPEKNLPPHPAVHPTLSSKAPGTGPARKQETPLVNFPSLFPLWPRLHSSRTGANNLIRSGWVCREKHRECQPIGLWPSLSQITHSAKLLLRRH